MKASVLLLAVASSILSWSLVMQSRLIEFKLLVRFSILLVESTHGGMIWFYFGPTDFVFADQLHGKSWLF